MLTTIAVALAACSDEAPDTEADAGSIDLGSELADAGPLDGAAVGSPDTGTEDAGAEDAGGGDAGVSPEVRLVGYLLGSFDNRTQQQAGFPQLVERHVCPLPGMPQEAGVTWLYVEHLEVGPQGRDAYFIRVNRIERSGDNIASRAYRFPEGHPLRTNAFMFNGPRDACFGRTAFGAVTEADLDYRAGCDVTFVQAGENFSASSPEETCGFPGGWIQTQATVYPDGLDVLDRAVTPAGESGSTFEFRRVGNFMPPGG